MKFTFCSTLSVAAILCATAAAPAHADSLVLTLDQPTITAAPGSTVSFAGTFLAPANNTGTLTFLGDDYNVDGPLSVSDNAFYSSAPDTLAPGDPFQGALFTVTLPGDVPEGSYQGYFTVEYAGSNGAEVDGTARFNVNAAAVTPEPQSWLLLLTGLAGLAGLAGLSKVRLRYGRRA